MHFQNGRKVEGLEWFHEDPFQQGRQKLGRVSGFKWFWWFYHTGSPLTQEVSEVRTPEVPMFCSDNILF